MGAEDTMTNFHTPHRVQAVVFDWAGTILDFGSRAPMGAFVQLFKDFGIDITIAQARSPMGAAKSVHIHALCSLPEVAAQWERKYGKPVATSDIDHLYEVFTPMNARVVGDFADFIPGALDVIAKLRADGIKIGSTTGYNRPIMDMLEPIAAKNGYAPDNIVCAGDLAAGRPSPLMMYRCFADLGVWPASTVVKVDDTGVGIAEGLNAGCWTVGVAISGNANGLSLPEWQALPSAEQAAIRATATKQLQDAGAHFVIDSVADLMPVIAQINQHLQKQELPARAA